MRVRARWPVLAVLLGAVGLLAGCGGGGASGGGTTARQSTGGQAATEGSDGARGGGDEAGRQARQAAKRRGRRVARERAYDREHFGVPSKRSAPFAKYSPKSDPQSHLHLAEFGDEAAAGDRAEVQEVLNAYLAAVGSQEWDVACSHLTKEGKAQVRAMAPEDGGEGSCGQGLPEALIISGQSTHPKPDSASDGVASLRIKRGGLSGEGAGFALFHSEGADYWVAVKREGGAWRLLSISPEEFLE